jgi:endoglucanase
MRKDTEQMLKELTEASGIPGFEFEVREVIRRYVEPLGEISQDRLGSILCRKVGAAEGPTIMLPGHMDEIGFMVKLITEKGFLKLSPVGGWWEQVVLAQRVIVQTHKGNVVGIIGSKPPHILKEDERGKPTRLDAMFVDIGAKDKKAAEAMGVRPGDPIVPVSPYERMGKTKCLLAKAWDDRAGCALFIEVLKQLQTVKHPNTVYGVGTVQEEVGCRGAKTSVSLVNPDVAIICEVGIAADVPGIAEDEAQGVLGGGPQICVRDGGMIPSMRLRNLAVEVAEKNKIPYQFTMLERGATDGGPIHVHAEGVPSLYIGIPTRHIHSHAGIIHETDFDNTVKLVVEMVKRLDGKTVAGLTQ